MNRVEKNLDRIKDLCVKHNVSRLFVLGSVLTSEFEESSDIDFLVDFINIDIYDYADNYFNLKACLEALLGREVDLLEDKAIKNPYLRESIDASKKLIYGPRDKNLAL
jgi:predicted nucleotidyltransferase